MAARTPWHRPPIARFGGHFIPRLLRAEQTSRQLLEWTRAPIPSMLGKRFLPRGPVTPNNSQGPRRACSSSPRRPLWTRRPYVDDGLVIQNQRLFPARVSWANFALESRHAYLPTIPWASGAQENLEGWGPSHRWKFAFEVKAMQAASNVLVLRTLGRPPRRSECHRVCHP